MAAQSRLRVGQLELYLRARLVQAPPDRLALGVLGTASKALGYGAREQTLNINTSFVVALPPAAKDSRAWVEGRTIEQDPTAVGRSRTSPEPT